MSLIAKTVEVAGHKVSAWGVGTRRFINFTSRYPDELDAVKSELEKEGWRVEIDELGFGLYMLTAEITVPGKSQATKNAEEAPDEPDSSDSGLE